MVGKTQRTPNHLLRGARIYHSWTQQKLADELGTTQINISRWERGTTAPSPYFRQKLCKVFKRTPQELGLAPHRRISAGSAVNTNASSIAPPAPDESAWFWNVPYRRNPFFTGREDVLEVLQTALFTGKQPVALAQPQAISGLGGIGKTQTAVEYANRHREAYQAVFWVRAESRHVLTSDFLSIATLLKLPQRNDQDQNSIVQAVLRWLDMHERWLLILDNVENLEIIGDFLPSANTGHVLLTTRAHALGTLAQRIDLEKMSVQEGVIFLLRRIKRFKDHTSLEHIPLTMRDQARAIVEAMDGLPLALDQAGAYIEETECGLDDYLKYFKTGRQRLLNTRGRNVGDHPEPVTTTWSLAFEKVEQANRAAAELLRLCAFLHPDEIPERMIMEGASELGSALQIIAADELEWNEAIGELNNYSLIKRDPQTKLLNIHRLVQAVIRDGMTVEAQRAWAAQTVCMISKVFPKAEFATWPACQLYLPQVSTCLELVKQYAFVLPQAADVFHRAGTYLYERGQYTEAEALLQQALDSRKQILDELHPDRADSLNALGILCHAVGKYEQAERLLQSALAIRENTLGNDHPDVTGSLDGLGWLNKTLGQYDRAEYFLQRSLTILEQAFEPLHPRIAEGLNELGVLYNDQGRYEEAEDFFLRSYAIIEKTIEHTSNSPHPFFAGILNNLAVLYRKQGRLQQGLPLMQRALAIQEDIFGPDHPNVATSLSNLAMLYDALGDYEQAETLMQRAISIRERVLGFSHLNVAAALNKLARIYMNARKYEQVEQLYQRILSIRERILGQEHPLTQQTIAELADFHSM